MKEPLRLAYFRRRFDRCRLPMAFVCGSPHTGTSILTRILAEHSAVYAPLRDVSAFGGRPSQAWRTLSRLCADARSAGRRMLVEKSTEHVHVLDDLRRALPESRVLLTMRDGRDVTASIGFRFDGDFARGLREWVSAAREVARWSADPDCMLVRYEDLVADAPAVIARVCGFLGLSYEPAMLEFHRHAVVWGPPPGEWTDALHGQHVLRRRAQMNTPLFDGRGAWRATLPEHWSRVLDSDEAGDLMRRFGYLVD